MNTKPDLNEEYAEYVRINSEDEYSKAVVDAGEAVASALDEGKNANEALEQMKGRGLTGFMASMVAKTVAHFHPRGEEIRVEWNLKNGISIPNGIVNAAVMNVSDDGKMIPEIEAT